MANKAEYLEFVTEWMSPLGDIAARAMFGGHVLYCNGFVFALISDNVLHLKVDDVTRPRFEEKGLQPFRPYEDRDDVMQYYPPPPEFFEDADTMREWARLAIEASRRAQAKKKPAQKKRTGAR